MWPEHTAVTFGKIFLANQQLGCLDGKVRKREKMHESQRIWISTKEIGFFKYLLLFFPAKLTNNC